VIAVPLLPLSPHAWTSGAPLMLLGAVHVVLAGIVMLGNGHAPPGRQKGHFRFG
jgi:hypothetical protein